MEAWRAFNESATETGWNTLPLATSSSYLLLAGRQQPTNQEALLIGFTSPGLPKPSSLPQSKGFRVEIVNLPFQDRRYNYLAIMRHTSASIDIFSAMLEDIVGVLERSEQSEAQHITAVIDRIANWQRFMRREDDGVLKGEEEVGLIGEVNFLRLLILHGVPLMQAVTWWQGPSDSLHDFVCERGDIEVKSSVRVGPFSANVGSLDQLDESLVDPLYVAAIQLSLSPSGLNLPQHIDVVRQLLVSEPDVLSIFEGKILAAGYHSVSALRYQRQFSYLLTTLFQVTKDFPKLTKATVPLGVIDAKYRLEIDDSKFHPHTLTDVLERIG